MHTEQHKQDLILSPLRGLCGYLKQTTAAIAPMFAIMAPMILGSIGGAIDVGQVYLVKQRLTHALDAATLAAAASESDEAAINDKVNQFLELNYPAEKIGLVYDIEVKMLNDKVYASAKADYDTQFLNLIGITELTVDVDTAVKQEVQGIEVVLVLDVTGSMEEEIETLEESVKMFVNRLCLGTKCPENVKIAYVPFSAAVNVGPYGLGKDESGNYYGAPFVNNPTGRTYHPTTKDRWAGCVLENKNNDTDGYFQGNWNMFRNNLVTWNSSTKYNYESYSHYTTNSKGKKTYYYFDYNKTCNPSVIVPLTNDKSRLLQKADFNADGFTLGNIGMMWGLRVLTPDFPFQEGAPWTDKITKRVIVMMTDGDNNIGTTGYTAYGPAANDGVDNALLDTKFAAVCKTAKEDFGVDIYTITFSNGVDKETEKLYKTCASDPSNFYDVDESSDLSAAYDNIAKELSNLHITD